MPRNICNEFTIELNHNKTIKLINQGLTNQEIYNQLTTNHILTDNCVNYFKTKKSIDDTCHWCGDFETTPINQTNYSSFLKDKIQTLKQHFNYKPQELSIYNQNYANECEMWLGFITPLDSSKKEFGNVFCVRNIFDFIFLLSVLPYQTNYIDFHNLSFDGVFITTGLLTLGFKQKNLEDVKNEPKWFTTVINNNQWYQIVIHINGRTIMIRDSYKIATTKLIDLVKNYGGIESTDKHGETGDIDVSRYVNCNEVLDDKTLNYVKFDSLGYMFAMKEIRLNQSINQLSASSLALKRYKDIFNQEIDRIIGNCLKQVGKHQEITVNVELIARLRDSKFDLFVKEEKYFIYLAKKVGQPISDKYNKRFTLNHFKNQLWKVLCPYFNKDEFLTYKKAYTGGHTFVNHQAIEHFKKQHDFYQNIGLVFDVNSLYPSVMSLLEKLETFINQFRTKNNKQQFLYPYGKPKRGERADFHKCTDYKNGTYPLAIVVVSIESFKIKTFKNGLQKMPNIRTSLLSDLGIDSKTFLYESLKDGKPFRIPEITLTSVELDDLLQRYDIKINYKYSFLFKGTRNIHESYVNIYYKDKQDSKGVKRQVAKLLLNAIYGKFGTNILHTVDYLAIDEHKHLIIKHLQDEYGVDLEELDDSQTFNVVMASFITAYARLYLLTVGDLLLSKGFHCVYNDTDSLHILTGNQKELKHLIKFMTDYQLIDLDKTGERLLWDCEGVFIEGYYLAPKKYSEYLCVVNEPLTQLIDKPWDELYQFIQTNGERKYACSGFSLKDNIKHHECFNICPNVKEVKTLYKQGLLYHEPLKNGIIQNPHLYYDKELTKPVIGAFIQTKKQQVNGGLLLPIGLFTINEHFRGF